MLTVNAIISSCLEAILPGFQSTIIKLALQLKLSNKFYIGNGPRFIMRNESVGFDLN